MWNARLAGEADVPAATAAAMVCGALVLAPFALAGWEIERAAWPYLAGSIVAEATYMSLLATAYSRADVSVVYPVARGSAPVLVLAVAGAGALQAAGVLLVVAGVLAVRGLRRPESAQDLALALAIGVTIATYTLLDKEGLRHAATIPYLWVEVGGGGLLYALLVVRPRRVAPAIGARTAAIGVAAIGSYGLVLAALEIAPAAAVAAVRETSIVFAVALGALWLGEPVTRTRAAGAVVVAMGVALLAAG